jgi:hypothetical protein
MRKPRIIALCAVLAAILATPFAPSIANAAPSPAAAPASTVTVADILRTNPKAKQVGPNTVQVLPGVNVVVPPSASASKGSLAAVDSSAVLCSYKHLCVYEAYLGIGSEGGVYIDFYDCVSVNLGQYRYPDFVYVGSASGPKWNDRISAVFDNQTSAARYPQFYNWTGSAWQSRLSVGHGVVMPYVGDLLNDTLDRVDVC